jgi:hypothetical protein
MICFRDRQFCASDCVNSDCYRNFSDEQKAAAEKWWGGPDAPIDLADLSDGCADYKPGEN